MNKILLIDNNDSFTYNLVQILEENDCYVKIMNNHDALLEDLSKYSGIVISPGPGNPSDYKNLFEFLKFLHCFQLEIQRYQLQQCCSLKQDF